MGTRKHSSKRTAAILAAAASRACPRDETCGYNSVIVAGDAGTAFSTQFEDPSSPEETLEQDSGVGRTGVAGKRSTAREAIDRRRRMKHR